MRGDAVRYGNSAIALWLANHPEIQQAVYPILSTQITGAWTAFEVLAEDLWVTAVNSDLRLAKTYLKPEAKNQEKTFSASDVLEMAKTYGAELPKNIGTILRDTEKATLDPLKALRFTYEKTFGRPVETILSSPDLYVLELGSV